MEQKTLKYLRIFIPGIIILIGLYPLLTDYILNDVDFGKMNAFHFTIVTFISIIIGGIYYQLNIQRLITKPSHHFIQKNILNKLIKASEKEIDENSLKALKHKNAYMTIFYKIVDGDASLKKKSENVMFNGIFWTSTADIALISIFFFLFYKYFYQLKNFDTNQITLVCITIFFLSLLLHIISVFKHINLSNKQLDPMIDDSELNEKVNENLRKIIR